MAADAGEGDFRAFAITFQFLFWMVVMVLAVVDLFPLTIDLLTVSVLAPVFIMSLSRLGERETPWGHEVAAPAYAWAPYWASTVFELATVAFFIQLVMFVSGWSSTGPWLNYPVFLTGGLFFLLGTLLLFPSSWNMLEAPKGVIPTTIAKVIASFILVLASAFSMPYTYDYLLTRNLIGAILPLVSYAGVGLSFVAFALPLTPYRRSKWYWRRRIESTLLLTGVSIVLFWTLQSSGAL